MDVYVLGNLYGGWIQVILYEGKSLLDPAVDIVVIATEDSNPKTGRMLYTWILRQDRAPEVAAYDGSDDAICGDCKFRTQFKEVYKDVDEHPRDTRTCYVRLSPAEGADEAMPPSEVWRKWKAGEFSSVKDSYRSYGFQNGPTPGPWRRIGGFGGHAQYLGPLPVHIGSYGDPAAVPTRVWAELVRYAKHWTGYCHMWKPKNCLTCKGEGEKQVGIFLGFCGKCNGTGKLDCCDPDLKKYCMASVDTLEERDEAQALGWRTFMVVPEVDLAYHANVAIHAGDILCPATDLEVTRRQKERGRDPVTCATCMLCRGTSSKSSKSIWEVAHGENKDNHKW